MAGSFWPSARVGSTSKRSSKKIRFSSTISRTFGSSSSGRANAPTTFRNGSRNTDPVRGLLVRDLRRDARFTDLEERLGPLVVHRILGVAIHSGLVLELDHEGVVITLRLH